MCEYNEDKAALKQLFERDALSVPHELEPDRMTERLKKTKPINYLYRYAALAATVIVCVGCIWGAVIHKQDCYLNAVPPQIVEKSEPMTPPKRDYKNVYKAISTAAKNGGMHGADSACYRFRSEPFSVDKLNEPTADIVKEHEGYLFAGQGNKLRVLRPQNGKLNQITEIKLGNLFSIKDIWIIDGARIAVLADRSDDYGESGEYGGYYRYSYSCDPYPGGSSQTYIFVYDISDPENLKQTFYYLQDGNYAGSQLRNGCLYVASVYLPSEISEKNYKKYLPGFRVSDGEKQYVSSDKIYVAGNRSCVFYSVSGVNLNGDLQVDMVSSLGSYGDVMFEDGHINILQSDCIRLDSMDEDDYPKTHIVRVGASGGRLKLMQNTVFNGWFQRYDLFGTDESDGFLRVVSYMPSGKYETVLRVFDSELNTVSQTEILRGDYPRYVQFIGDMLYMVTPKSGSDKEYIQYSISLEDVRKPKIKTNVWDHYLAYMYPVGDNKYISLEMRSNGRPQIRLIDLSDKSSPRLLDSWRSTKATAVDTSAYYSYKAIVPSDDGIYIPFEKHIEPYTKGIFKIKTDSGKLEFEQFDVDINNKRYIDRIILSDGYAYLFGSEQWLAYDINAKTLTDKATYTLENIYSFSYKAYLKNPGYFKDITPKIQTDGFPKIKHEKIFSFNGVWDFVRSQAEFLQFKRYNITEKEIESEMKYGYVNYDEDTDIYHVAIDAQDKKDPRHGSKMSIFFDSYGQFKRVERLFY